MSCKCPSQTDSTTSNADLLQKTEQHPCYSAGAHQKYARMHLPVAPACNISCNYCNRKFDCVNESRPGVTSEILSPDMAKEKFLFVKEKIENLTVVGIAGPGDALANWPEVRRSIELIKEASPETTFCLSTNGLMLPEYAAELVALGIRHVTVTVNCLDPQIGARIYKVVTFKGESYRGETGAELLIKNQLAGIEYLAKRGVLVKVNIVMIKEINDSHIPLVVKRVKELGAFITNIMPLIPAPGSVFEKYPQTSMKEINEMRNLCQLDIQQMRHCQQCRADAIGLLKEDRSQEFRSCSSNKQTGIGEMKKTIASKKYKIAVTSKYGKLVDLHFGHAAEFMIYEGDGHVFQLLEMRKSAKYCLGMEDCDEEVSRRKAIIATIADCDAVLTMRIGYNAQKMLKEHGIDSIESCYTIENGLAQCVKQLSLQEAI
ncbi:hypothetical protein P22_3021 [Propionispora sp. 2/2-37]|uniref:nitrogenase cofactor biosynthesis protein NifB n=1 Tax=Propionispora sp. 2/2-37 TaxID=1677858 RepID=UPI0006BB65B1|nr:nitrogenase cofactor biosynthesis protein NifB [Propionispora sp. 2/2-37]CUH96909.1 hypothetical protein P22_3021 [Propionispora sp. 2/2-37]